MFREAQSPQPASALSRLELAHAGKWPTPAVTVRFPYPSACCRWFYCCLVAFGVVLLPLPRHCRAADDVATGPASTTAAPPDQQVAALLNKLRQQVFAGHTTIPPSDNAVETWLAVAKLTASHLSPGAATALDDFVHTVQSEDTAKQAAGRGTIAQDLLVFADFAVAELKDRSIDNAPLPPASPAPALRPSPPEHAMMPAEARTADMTAQPPHRDGGSETTPATLPSAAATPAGVAAATLAASVQEAPAARPIEMGSARAMPATLATAAMPAAPPTPAETATQPTSADDAALMAAYIGRGDQMLAIKDISAARKFYEYATSAGSAGATAKLAETYDPDFLRRIGAMGLQPDVAKAVALYRQAAALGDTEAQERLRMLNQEAAR